MPSKSTGLPTTCTLPAWCGKTSRTWSRSTPLTHTHASARCIVSSYSARAGRLVEHVRQVRRVLGDDDPGARRGVLDRDEAAGQADVPVDDGGVERAAAAGRADAAATAGRAPPTTRADGTSTGSRVSQ